MRETPILRTGRLVLRPRRVDDADALHPGFADVDAMRWWSGPPHASVEQTRSHFEQTDPAWRCWAITLSDSGDAVGFVAAGEKRQGNVTELGYMLLRSHWGRAIASEAIGAVIDQIFGEGQRRVFADTDPDNLPSRRLLETLGFTLEGVLRAEWETHIGVRDTTLYGLLTDQWSARRRD